MTTATSPTTLPSPAEAQHTVSWIEADRRLAPRSAQSLYARLTPLGATSAIAGKTENLGEQGFFVLVADQKNLTVGQRCEVELMNEDGETRLSALPIEGCYATVVRTEVITSSEGRCLGAGLRFDQPLFL